MMAEPKKQKSGIIKDAVALFVITLIAGALLGLVNQITKEPIAKAELTAKEHIKLFLQMEKNLQRIKRLTRN